ncbi:unnamed protein product [Chrysoparadoxa australica]
MLSTRPSSVVIAEVGMGHHMHCYDADADADKSKVDHDVLAGISQILRTAQMWFFDMPRKLFWHLPGNSLKREFRRKEAKLDAVIDKLIAEARKEDALEETQLGGEERHGGVPTKLKRGNLLQKLVAASNASDKVGLSDEELRTNLKGYFVAGSDTTSRLMSWVVMFLCEDQARQARLQEELDRVMGAEDYPSTHEMLEKMTYLQAILKEGMRHRGPINRILLNNSEEWRMTDGRVYPPWTLFICAFNAAQHKDAYFSKPDEFIPERWIPEERETALGPNFNHNEKACVGFGGGPRMCPGKGLAMLEATVLLASAYKQFSIELKPGHPAVEFREDVSLAPSMVEIVLKPRQ